jgi:anti-sigma regulatory factor (Ser/Thr protein kinase)
VVTARHRLTLRNDAAEIVRMTAWIDDLRGALDLSPRTVHALQLSLEEAVTNIVSHALKPGTPQDVRIALWRDRDMVHAEVSDDGPAFDPLSHAMRPPPRDLQSAPIGGFGIKLMRSFADSIAYRRCGATNVLLLCFIATRPMPKELGGPAGLEPTRYGDWEVSGRCSDF